MVVGRWLRAVFGEGLWLDAHGTRALVERLRTEPPYAAWRLGGGRWEWPSEATFSRAFAEFAASDLLEAAKHEVLLDRTRRAKGRAIVSRDSTCHPTGRGTAVAPKPAPMAQA